MGRGGSETKGEMQKPEGCGKCRVRTKASLPRIRANPSGIFLLVPMMLQGGGDVKWKGGDRAVSRGSAIIKTTLSMDT